MQRQRLIDLREKQGMTQEDLAKRLGKDRSVISKWEQGACDMSGRVLSQLAEIFQTTMEDIYGGPVHALPPRRRL